MDYLQYYYNLSWSIRYSNNVLNLIINGLPSILNTSGLLDFKNLNLVLNLIINGLPSILLESTFGSVAGSANVLNLIINGLPSIQLHHIS